MQAPESCDSRNWPSEGGRLDPPKLQRCNQGLFQAEPFDQFCYADLVMCSHALEDRRKSSRFKWTVRRDDFVMFSAELGRYANVRTFPPGHDVIQVLQEFRGPCVNNLLQFKRLRSAIVTAIEEDKKRCELDREEDRASDRPKFKPVAQAENHLGDDI